MLAALILSLLETSAMPTEGTLAAYEEREVLHTGGEYKNEAFKYRLLKPARIEAGKKYPLVLYLHGAGERGDDNRMQLVYLPEHLAQPKQREKYECFVLAPQCRAERKWVELNWSDRKSIPQAEPTEQMRVVVQMLDEVEKNFPVDADRVYLTGLSMGGYGTWDLAARMPKRFAAIVPICGGGDEQKASTLVAMPIWAWHGDADPAVPVERTRTMIQAIKEAGGDPKYTELKGVGHNSWTPAYEGSPELLDWLFAQRRGS